MEDLERFLTASGEVIANLEEENNQLHAKAKFYEEVAEDLTIKNQSLLLKLQQKEEEYSIKQEFNKRIEVTFEPTSEDIVLEEEVVAPRDDEYEVEQVEQEKECPEETGFRQQRGRFTCIVCGRTRNTQSQINKHMQEHKETGEFVPAEQVHCAVPW